MNKEYFDNSFFESCKKLLSLKEFYQIQDAYKAHKSLHRRIRVCEIGIVGTVWAAIFTIVTLLFSHYGMGVLLGVITDVMLTGFLVSGVMISIVHCGSLYVVGNIGICVGVCAAKDVLNSVGIPLIVSPTATYEELGLLMYTGLGVLDFFIGFFVSIGGYMLYEYYKDTISERFRPLDKLEQQLLLSVKNEINVFLSNERYAFATFEIMDKEKHRKELNALDEIATVNKDVKLLFDELSLQGRGITRGEAYKIFLEHKPAYKYINNLAPGKKFSKREDKCTRCVMKKICPTKENGSAQALYIGPEIKA